MDTSQQLNTLRRLTHMHVLVVTKRALHVCLDLHNIKAYLFTGSLNVHGWLHVRAASLSSIGFCNACNGHNEFIQYYVI